MMLVLVVGMRHSARRGQPTEVPSTPEEVAVAWDFLCGGTDRPETEREMDSFIGESPLSQLDDTLAVMARQCDLFS